MKTPTKIRYYCVLLWALCLCHTTATAQTPRAKGLVFNAAQYQKSVKMRDLDQRGSNMREMPIRLSLRPFCPTPQDQGAEPSCTAWAIAYGAMTIQQALHRKIPAGEVDKIACSKSFVYNQISQHNTDSIPTIEETFTFLRNQGTCLSATFRNDLPITEKPDDLAIYEAQSRRLVMVTEVYDPDSTIKVTRQLQRFKRFLADSIPVIVGMQLPYSFSNLTEKTYRYHAEEPLDAVAHAMCLIGYDDIDSTFECMNSWGTSWGNDHGFVRLKYNDFFALLRCAYRITPLFLAEKKTSALRGAVVLRSSAGYNSAHVPQFEEIRVRYDTVQQYYQGIQPHWQIGTGFQVALREVPDHWWVYVFNINKHGEVTIFHRDQINKTVVEKVIPGEEAKFEIEEAGTDWLGVLYSQNPVPDFQAPLQAWLKNKVAAANTQTALFFKDILQAQPVLTPYRMGFTFGRNSKATAVLMFLKIETQ